MTYTDDNAVLPAKNILLGIAVICAVLFFLNVWRRTWLLPSVGLALLAVSAILLGLIWPGIVQQFQVKPSEADKEAPYIADEHRRHPERRTTSTTSRSTSYRPTATTADDGWPRRSPRRQVRAAGRPAAGPADLRAEPAGARATTRWPTCSTSTTTRSTATDRALVLGVRELDQSGINQRRQNWLNLHTVYTHGNGIIAAFANQRNAANQPRHRRPGHQTTRPSGPRATSPARTRSGTRDRRLRDRGSTSASTAPTTRSSARRPTAPSVELDLSETSTRRRGGSAEQRDHHDVRRRGRCRRSVRRFRQLLYAIKFGEHELPALRAGSTTTARSSTTATPRDRVQKVAPWLTLDDDAYPAVVDGRIVWILDGYTTTDRFPGAERESFKTMTDDSLQDETGLRTLPTDEINYMRNAVKATVDAYDGTVTLYEWDDQDPILKAWSSAFPGTVKPKSDIPEDLLQHLRYPEDMFKVQRYQFARYHVTDPTTWYQGNNRWEVPEDPNAREEPAAAVPDVRDPAARTDSRRRQRRGHAGVPTRARPTVRCGR